MRTIACVMLGMFVVCVAGCNSSSNMAASNVELSGEMVGGVRVIKMTAQKYEFIPSVIVVNEGDKVRLEITGKDVTHGLAISGYPVDVRIDAGKTATTEFAATKSGTFGFHCSVFCGMGHMGMSGKLIVRPSGSK
jgi:cytochrome c oxidase subunit 2